MSTFDIFQASGTVAELPTQDYQPMLKEVSPATDGEREQYLKQLHQYFINGRKTTHGLSVNATPVLLAPILKANTSNAGSLIEFSTSTAFQLLSLQLKKRKEHHQAFLDRLQNNIAGLNELLQLHSKKADDNSSNFDFARELISFDRITNLTSSGDSAGLPATRVKHLRHCLQTLTEAYKAYSDKHGTVFTTQKLADEFDLPHQLNNVAVMVSAESPCKRAKDYFEKENQEFVQIIAALRLAELEVNYEYEEGLHEPYFEGFDRSYLSDDDIRYFRPLIVVEESRQLTQQPQAFLSMLSDSDFIRVLAINRLDDIGITIDNSYLELAALAIFRRNAYVFQGGTDQTDVLNESFQKGLEAPCPTLWNILIPKAGIEVSQYELLALKAGIESRFFPRLEYDIQSGDDFGGHFDISGNLQPGQHFPSFELEIKTPAGNTVQSYVFTAADFLALDPRHLRELEVIPPQYHNEQLIPLAEYLSLPHESATGKIPFIWLVDEQHILRQAAIPISWLRCCQAGIDYWRFIQELGGAGSDRYQRGIQEAQSDWEAGKAAEIEDLKKQLRSEFDRSREQDLEQAIKRILHALLDTDLPIEDILNQAGSKPSPLAPQEVSATEPSTLQEEKAEGKAKETPTSSEAWIESDLCTSCSDCINALPGVFKYNDEKQAYVHDPKGGSYAKIVAAAEKCPALCIHPGLPQDTSEPGLEKLIKRAEKYN